MKDYYNQAVACVKDSVLPAQRELYEKYSGDFDAIYSEGMNSELYSGRVIESGHVYELGYHSCTCGMVLSGEVTDPAQCECSRQSILYVLKQLEPESEFEVEIMESVLRGSDRCKFRITKR